MLRGAVTCHYHSKVNGTLKFSLKLGYLTALLVSLTCTVIAQQTSEANQAPFNPAAYRLGERLTYNVAFSQFVSAAHVELFVAARGIFFNRDGIQLRAHVETMGVVNVALFAVNNDYTTYVDPQSGLPFRARQVVRQAGRTTEVSSDYNQPAGVAAIPANSGSGVFSGTYDLLSALYRIRAMPLADGALYLITVHNEGDQYSAEVKVIGRQLIKTNVGSFNTIVTRVSLKNGHDYNIRVYFSDDERHVPVLITAKHPSGEIRAELAGSELSAPARPTPPSRTSVTPPTALTPQDSRPPQASSASRSVVPTSAAGAGETALAGLDLPFKVGEQLNYRVYLGNASQQVGSIAFTVRARGRYFNRDGLLFAVSAQTTASGSRVFFVNDQINSYVDPATLLPFRTEISLSEGRFRSNQGYNLDQNRGAAVTDNRDRIEIPVGTHDLISAIYAIRTFDLSPQRQNAISIMATSKPRTLLVKSQRREIIELNGQKISALMLTLTTDDPQGDQMQLRMWVGDDGRHLPLRIAAVTNLGPLHADLVVVPVTSQ